MPEVKVSWETHAKVSLGDPRHLKRLGYLPRAACPDDTTKDVNRQRVFDDASRARAGKVRQAAGRKRSLADEQGQPSKSARGGVQYSSAGRETTATSSVARSQTYTNQSPHNQHSRTNVWSRRAGNMGVDPVKDQKNSEKIDHLIYIYAGGEELTRINKDQYDKLTQWYQQERWKRMLEDSDDEGEEKVGFTSEDINYSTQLGCAVICAKHSGAMQLADRLLQRAQEHPDLKDLGLAGWPEDEMPVMTNWCIELRADWMHYLTPEKLVLLLRKSNKIKGVMKMTKTFPKPNGGQWVYLVTGESATKVIRENDDSLCIPTCRVQFLSHLSGHTMAGSAKSDVRELTKQAEAVQLSANEDEDVAAFFK